MSRTLLAGFLGALVIFFWGFLSWVVLPFHRQTTHALPNEDAVSAVLKSGNIETGAYRIPGMGKDEAGKKIEMEKMKTGPIAWIHYHSEGYGEVDTMYLVKGFLLNFLAALVAASLLGKLSWSLASKYGARVRFVMTLGIFLAIAGHLSDWAFLGYSTGFTLNVVADDVISWTLAGLVIAWRIKPLMTKPA